MPEPYNYTIDLPKPPAQNFIQNIMGIAQLQNMSQQQEIAAQQAAFQKEMQPLEMDKVREQIKAAQASAAQSAASTRGLNISADEAKRQQDYIKEVDAFTSKPVSEWAKQDVERLASLSITRDPKIGKGLQDFYASQKEPELKLIDNYAMKAGIAISQGRKDVADKITKEGIAEADKLGFKTASAFFKFGDSQIADDPAEAYATIVGHLARDKNKLDQFIAASELKGKLAETEAKAKETRAKANTETWQGALTKWKAQNAMKGELDPEEIVKRENSLRENFLAQPAVRGYQDKIESYDNVKTAKPTTPGDVAKMTAFIKLGDPRSTVSMGESGQLVASNIGEKTAKLVEQFNLNGGKLTDDMRKKIDLQADATMRAAKKSFENGILRGFNETAKRQKINPENVTGFLPPVSIAEENQGPTSEEERIRAMLRPAAGFGNTMTPSQIQPQGGTFQGTPTDVDAILKQYAPR